MINEELSELLSSLPEKLQTIKSEVEITPEEQATYIDYHDKIDLDEYPEKNVLAECDNLFKKDYSVEEKKRICFCLAHFGTLESFKVLDKYLKKPDKELTAWVVLCTEECRMFLESELMDEDRAVVIGGAGGDGNRMRFYFIVSSPKERDFSQREKTTIEGGYAKIEKELDTKVEYIEFNHNYALISGLIPMDVAPEDFVMSGLKQCNKSYALLRKHYYASNMKKPDKNVIEEYLEQVKNS